jgi:hypothetical protein
MPTQLVVLLRRHHHHLLLLLLLSLLLLLPAAPLVYATRVALLLRALRALRAARHTTSLTERRQSLTEHRGGKETE